MKKKIISYIEPIKFQISPVYVNLYSDPIEISIISFVKEKLICELKLENDTDLFNSSFSIKSYKKDIINIYFKIPELKIKESSKYKLNAKLIVALNTKLKEKEEFDCEFNITLIPFKILIFNDKFNLSYLNNKFILNLDYIHTSDHLIFYFKKYFEIKNERIAPKIQLISKENNSAKIPKYEIKNDQIIIENQEEDKKRLNFILNIFFNESFKIPIELDLLVIPFNYSFEVYDYNKEDFVENSTTIYLKNNNKFNQNFYFRILLPKTNLNYQIKLNDDNSKNSSIKDNKIKYILHSDKSFSLNKNYYFKVTIEFSNLNKNFKYIISCNINNLQKKIIIEFIINNKNITSNFIWKEDYNYNKESKNKSLKDINNFIRDNKKINYLKENNESEAFLVEKNLPPEKILRREKTITINQKQEFELNTNQNDIIGNNFMLPDINLKKPFSLNDYLIFISNCTLASRIIPSYVKQLYIAKKDLKNAEKYFIELYNIYNSFIGCKDSFFSSQINEFIESFNIMIYKFEKSNINFDNIDIEKNIFSQMSDGIKYPILDYHILIPNWKIINNEKILNNINLYNENENKMEDKMEDKMDDKNDENLKSSIINNKKKNKIDNKINNNKFNIQKNKDTLKDILTSSLNVFDNLFGPKINENSSKKNQFHLI